MEEYPRKRRKHHDPPPLEDSISLDEEFWKNAAFLYLSDPQTPISPRATPTEEHSDTWDGVEVEAGQLWENPTSFNVPSSSPTIIEFPDPLFPDLYPSMPLKESRLVDLSLQNPFTDNAIEHLPYLRPSATKLPQDGAVNGYVKFRLIKSNFQEHQPRNKYWQVPLNHQDTVMHRWPIPNPYKVNNIVKLPPDFSLGCKLDGGDHKLLKFYTVAWCEGRTILPKTNSWLVDLVPMITTSKCLRHTLLALASTYLLDYLPDEKLRSRANRHYKTAVDLLSEGLSDPTEQGIGKGDALIGAITLFNMHDVVTWEHRRPRSQVPRWLEGARLASKLLDSSDPGYRYWKPDNVQSSVARISNSIIVARAAILALPMTPLNVINTNGQFGWLLRGTERESRKIHGGLGFSPKLLHTFAQITHLAARMAETPDSVIIPLGAEKIQERLGNYRQWSELSEGCASTKVLLDSCDLNSHGVIECPIKMTELGGEAWLVAAQVYLQCRFFRLPRNHPAVLASLADLSECIKRMPCSGPLFTAQAPFFPVFLMGFVSTRDEDRKVAHTWFEKVLSTTSCRSSVPPAFQALQNVWQWMDGALVDDDSVDAKPIGQRKAWWEDVVAWLMDAEGTLCLI